MPQGTPKFKGVALFMNGQSYLVPSLSLDQFEEHYAALTEPVAEVEGVGLFEQFKKYVPIIGVAIRRNYPEVTDVELREWLDLNTFREAFLAVQASSGLKVSTPGE
jgi:hypothetical protein